MIDIAVAYDKFTAPKSGGAQRSLHTLLSGLADEFTITVTAYQTPPSNPDFPAGFDYTIVERDLVEVPKLTWTNQVVQRIQWQKFLRRELDSDTDLLITQNELGPASVQVAAEKNIPSLFFVRSLLLTGYEKYTPDLGHLSNFRRTDLGGRVQYPLLVRNFREYGRANRTATRTIANSQFTADRLEELYGVKPEVVYPPIDPDEYCVPYDPNGTVTMVNPRVEYKGPDIFLDIAERLSDESFLLVGPISSDRIRERAESLANVEHWEWCDDMREAYGRSKVVVVPSRCEESFGRVAAEAMVSGIPCVVSDRGGLPEVVGATGEVVHAVESIDAWIAALDDVLERHDPNAQKERARQFSKDEQIERLERILAEVVDT